MVEWGKNNKAYSIVFEEIKNRVSHEFLKTYLNNHGFHDFQITKIEVLDSTNGFKNPISIDIYISEEEDTYKITYRNIEKFNINYQEDEESEEKTGFDDWGYDEFLPVDEQTLSHEILFASGSTILIHFKNKNIFITKVN